MYQAVVSVLNERLDAVQTQVGIRQSLARDRNEQDNASHPFSSFGEYGCECASSACEQLLSLSSEEYEAVRTVPTHFVVARGHTDPRVAFVVDETSRYQVVETFGLAARVALRLDPHRRNGHLSSSGS
jgi:hypothetical protein